MKTLTQISLSLLTLSVLATPVVFGQNLSFASAAQTNISIAGLSGPTFVATDAKGDLFAIDSGNNRVVEVPVGGGALITIPTSGLNQPEGIAVDAKGDVFIGDTMNGRVVEVSPSGAQSNVLTGLSPDGLWLALDTAGNLFVQEFGQVLELTAGGVRSKVAVFSGFPGGIAVDAADDIFIVEGTGVVEFPASGGGPLTIANLTFVSGVAVNSSGDVFFATWQGSPATTLKVSASRGNPLPIAASLGGFSVALGPAGDLFIGQDGSVVKVQTTSVNFGRVNVCPAGQTTPAPCSETLTLTYNVSASGALGTPKVVTGGAPNLDFTLASGSTCTGFVSSDTACIVNVTFTPKLAGLRSGAVQITNGSGAVLATTFVYGTGAGPQLAFGPGTQSTLGSGLSDPFALSVDAAGDVFIADTGNSRVVEVAAGSGKQTPVVATGLVQPEGVAVDGAGDVFISDYETNLVVEVEAGSGKQITVGNGFLHPSALAVDGAGDLIIANMNGFNGNGNVVEMPAGGGPQRILPTVGVHQPSGLAVDAAGNVFIADVSAGSNVIELPAGGGAQITIPLTGGVAPTSVAVDAAGDIFVADSVSRQEVVELPAGGGAQITLLSGLGYLGGMAVDASGNVFATSSTLAVGVLELQRSQIPSLSFPATLVGSSAGPQSVTIENVGNVALAEEGLTVGANFAQVAGSGTPADCTVSSKFLRIVLAPGASCNLSINFEPLAGGALQSAAVLTNNSLNGNPATQSIQLSGIGYFATTTTLTASPSTSQPFMPVTFTATVTAPSGIPSGQVTFVFNGQTVGTVTLNASGVATLKFSLPPGSDPITANYAGTTTYLPSSATMIETVL